VGLTDVSGWMGPVCDNDDGRRQRRRRRRRVMAAATCLGLALLQQVLLVQQLLESEGVALEDGLGDSLEGGGGLGGVGLA